MPVIPLPGEPPSNVFRIWGGAVIDGKVEEIREDFTAFHARLKGSSDG